MITLQVTSNDGSNLHSALRNSIQEGKIKAFQIVQVKGGLKLQHAKYLGSVKLSKTANILVAAIKCKNKNKEWQILKAFIGLLTYHFKDRMASIQIHFDQ